MIQGIITRNKGIFSRYNAFRKKIFSELAPQESEIVLYMLPWLLSVNHPGCPGYVKDLTKGFKVYNVDNDADIRSRESTFKRKLGIKDKRSLLRQCTDYHLIQGVYTIGSIGTISQTTSSDCDIWVCYDRQNLDKTAWDKLNQKVNLIKDWLDLTIKMPVFFFISDAHDIQNGRFRNLDAESSGSAQKDVLKEEFYRTCIVVCGKIPLYWVSFDHSVSVEYAEALSTIQNPVFCLYDIIDFGNLDRVDRSEHLGAALWQLHKSLNGSLKSIIKMTLLKMQLDFPEEPLVCHRFREEILSKNRIADSFPDPMVFTMLSILNCYNGKQPKALIDFLTRCFYLRCELKPYDKHHPQKKVLANDLFKRYPIPIKERLRLGKFDAWDFDQQLELGNQLFRFLMKIYKEIPSNHTGIANDINTQDLKVLGRKILVGYQYKPTKIPVLQKPTNQLNLSDIIISLDEARWTIFSGKDKSRLLISSKDIVYNIAFMVWNDIFDPTRIHMEPNPSSVTIREINNLGAKMKGFFGKSNASEVEFSNYLKKEIIIKLLVVASFEKSPWEKDINDFAVVYKNSWGELFAKRFHSRTKLESFFKRIGRETVHVETGFYVQRNCNSYEKIIERTKRILSTLT
jgi:adenylate cyclase class 1